MEEGSLQRSVGCLSWCCRTEIVEREFSVLGFGTFMVSAEFGQGYSAVVKVVVLEIEEEESLLWHFYLIY